MRAIGIFGTSGFAHDVADIALELGYRVVFIANNEEEARQIKNNEVVVLESDLDREKLELFSIGIGDNKIREKIAIRYSSKKKFINLIHPSATFGFGQRLVIEQRTGVIICAGSRFSNNITVKDFSIFHPNCIVGHDVIVNEFVSIAPGACISGNVELSRCVWIGSGAVLNQGKPGNPLVVGEGVTVGSGAVVVGNCEPNAVYVGVPAKRIK